MLQGTKLENLSLIINSKIEIDPSLYNLWHDLMTNSLWITHNWNLCHYSWQNYYALILWKRRNKWKKEDSIWTLHFYMGIIILKFTAILTFDNSCSVWYSYRVKFMAVS